MERATVPACERGSEGAPVHLQRSLGENRVHTGQIAAHLGATQRHKSIRGSLSTQRELTPERGEHANSTQQDPKQGFEPLPAARL
ncbi:hypothetical protein CHARACLAT_003748 [Characodon lateralis]|uniref:Uncharacterized protein n=1 Tax=Characodon lateralis TaxID=208331 RepID=A0ABU7F146_9TELE|nr:hypothetical protein [Characodon lateralis]